MFGLYIYIFFLRIWGYEFELRLVFMINSLRLEISQSWFGLELVFL
jgi:hypothetical protein